MAIAGPNIQIPTSLTDMFEFDAQGKILSVKPAWASFWSQVGQLLFAETRNGPTSSRPTSALPSRYIGMPYFDTDLGFPVYLETASSDAWVRYDGTPV